MLGQRKEWRWLVVSSELSLAWDEEWTESGIPGQRSGEWSRDLARHLIFVDWLHPWGGVPNHPLFVYFSALAGTRPAGVHWGLVLAGARRAAAPVSCPTQ